MHNARERLQCRCSTALYMTIRANRPTYRYMMVSNAYRPHTNARSLDAQISNVRWTDDAVVSRVRSASQSRPPNHNAKRAAFAASKHASLFLAIPYALCDIHRTSRFPPISLCPGGQQRRARSMTAPLITRPRKQPRAAPIALAQQSAAPAYHSSPSQYSPAS